MLRVRSTTITLLALVLVALLLSAGTGGPNAGAAPLAPALGPNVIIFDPSMPVSQIQATVDAIYAQQVDAEMGTNRYALLFKPGVYGTASQPLQMKVGYYTEVAGLGASPADVTINGKIEVYNRCLDNGGTSNCLALVNFWRTLSNLSLQRQRARPGRLPRLGELLGGLAGRVDAPSRHHRRHPLAHGLLHGRAAVRQRRLHRRLEPAVRHQRLAAAVADPQQPDRRLVERRLEPGLRGCRRRARRKRPSRTRRTRRSTTTPVSREKPYLFVDGQGNYNVRVPSAQTQHQRHLLGRRPDGRDARIPLDDFFIAKPSDSVKEINNALARGMNLLLTPGVYNVGRQHLRQARQHGRARPGARDAHRRRRRDPAGGRRCSRRHHRGRHDRRGRRRSRRCSCGSARATATAAPEERPVDPTTLSDVYFRVGGPHIGKADIALEVNSNDVLIDQTWVWRADHGVEGFSGDTSAGTPTSVATASSSTVTTSPRRASSSSTSSSTTPSGTARTA